MADNKLTCERCGAKAPRLYQSYTDGKFDCLACALTDERMPPHIAEALQEEAGAKKTRAA